MLFWITYYAVICRQEPVNAGHYSRNVFAAQQKDEKGRNKGGWAYWQSPVGWWEEDRPHFSADLERIQKSADTIWPDTPENFGRFELILKNSRKNIDSPAHFHYNMRMKRGKTAAPAALHATGCMVFAGFRADLHFKDQEENQRRKEGGALWNTSDGIWNPGYLN